MEALVLLMLLAMLGRGSSSSTRPTTAPSSGPPQGAPPSALPTQPASLPAGGGAAPAIKTNTVPAGTRPRGDWRPYAPPPAGVVARATKILQSPSMGAQVVEPDPSGVFPSVLYQREKASTGRVSVTAWRGSQPRANA